MRTPVLLHQQPIYLNLKIRHGAGNEPEVHMQIQGALGSERQVKKVISINGEEMEASSLDHINIHDYTTFEKEDLITNKFKAGIKRKSAEGAGRGGLAGMSFKNVVHTMLHSEAIIKALKHYSHRSDSESDTEDDEKHPAHAPIAEGAPGITTALHETSPSPPVLSLDNLSHPLPPEHNLEAPQHPASMPELESAVAISGEENASVDLNVNANNSNGLPPQEELIEVKRNENVCAAPPKSMENKVDAAVANSPENDANIGKPYIVSEPESDADAKPTTGLLASSSPEEDKPGRQPSAAARCGCCIIQ